MYLQQYGLEGRVAVVTGGGRGIGLAIGRALGEAGARVVLAEIDQETMRSGQEALQAEGFEAVGMALDVTDPSRVDALADDVMASFGRVDVLVNCAGVFKVTPALDIPDHQWREVMDVNLNGLFWCSRAFGRHMSAARRGSVVNVGSMSGFIINRPQVGAHYMASKAAVHHLTKALAVEWAENGVRVNAIAPGYITTEMTIALKNTPDVYEANVGMIPMKRFGEPHEVAALALFLACDASSYITGSVMTVDGGYTAW